MRLVSLEIKGFKSFAEKTTINFNDNITGVVGPNGCGKSNVVDAIRWVLGEQKTSVLRSEKMENVIFNGTKERKPSSLAEVSLTFENNKNLLPTEFNTVTISRHYFRNGDSEYKLNNVTCRLKDITNLFLDTGISSDSYAIIELGMVNDILNDKDHSRRKLFEQAAGISKYKARKKETLNKLEATQADLNRVDDLLFEIDNNLKSLESQAKKTERYYKLKEEYKNLSVELAVHTIDGLKKSFDEIQKQQEEEEQKKIAIETDIIAKEAVLQQEKNDNIEKEKNLLAGQKLLNEVMNSVKQKENEKNILTENRKFQIDTKENLTQQNLRADETIKSVSESMSSLELGKGNEQTILSELQTALEAAKQSLETVRTNHSEAKRNLDSEEQKMQSIERELNEMERKMAVNNVKKENSLKEIAHIEEENKKRDEETARLNTLLQELYTKENAQRETIHQLTKADDELQLKITSTEETIDNVREQSGEVNRKLDARQNEYNLTKSFIDSMEGFPDSIKFLSQNPQWSTRAPLLSDIISCPAEYRIAIETYLENYLNYYVVSNMKEAFSAMNLLSSAAKGRANFFVLNDFDDFSPAAHEAPAGTVKAYDVMELEEPYRRLGAYLLSNVFIAENDFEIENITGRKNTVVISKSGKYVRQPYSVSGGQVGSFSGKRLGRIKNLEALSKEIETLQAESSALKEKITMLQQELLQLKSTSTDKKLDEAREQLNVIKNEIVSVRTKIEHIGNNHKQSIERKELIQQSLKEHESENELFALGKEDLLTQKNTQQESLTALEGAFRAVDTLLQENSTAFNQKNIQFLQQQNKVNSIAQEINFKQQQLAQQQQQFDNNTLAIASAEAQIMEIEQKLSVCDVELIHLYSQKSSQEQSVTELEQVYYDSRGKINDEEEKVKELHRSKEAADVILNQVKERTTELKIQLSALRERLEIEFKVNIEDLMDKESNPELNVEELKEKVLRMKNRIENFGEINPMAVEAFTEMKQRADFINGQKTDLLTAKESLLQTINEIETTAKQQFLDAFNNVKENFVNVFRGLFTPDDTCDLILSDPNNPLESEIEIIAKPKGKRPQTINQLSGGEKTLTAISLLFALYLLKPAPFCILDEVDAPLDDANIGKFNDIIKQFSKDSQFILVTHNKSTMSSVDVIYGVTMAEQGVSKVVPVDFRSLN